MVVIFFSADVKKCLGKYFKLKEKKMYKKIK